LSICISKNHSFPRITRSRNTNDSKNEEYLGPFSSVKSVDEALINIQKIFQLRNCSDHFFENRKRPCLQYDIKRCSAPCVGKINQIEYAENVAHIRKFLSGKVSYVRDFLVKKMEEASEKLDFENAAKYRDTLLRLENMKRIEKIQTGKFKDADVIFFLISQLSKVERTESSLSDEEEPTVSAGAMNSLTEQTETGAFGRAELEVLANSTNFTYSEKSPQASAMQEILPCVHVLFIRNGVYLGGDTFFLDRNISQLQPPEVVHNFLQQFYLQRQPPKQILCNILPTDKDLIETAIKEKYNLTIKIKNPTRGIGVTWLKQAKNNAQEQSNYESTKSTNFKNKIKQLAAKFALSKVPTRIEIYDNSHIQGAYSYGCMVVADENGFDKKAYRKFSVTAHKAEDKSQRGGSDFAMMEEMMLRRFKHAEEQSGSLPDLLIIDGGAGQVSTVFKVLEEYGLYIPIIGVAKGPDRNAGRERFFLLGWPPFSLPENDPLLHFIQVLRDEAHRFAIGTHRRARSRAFTKSQLLEIPSIGQTRRRELLLAFGSVAAIKQASIEDIKKVKGMTDKTAIQVYDYFR
jgi:excinuclease ABC subunit C